jgi:hypothetical protein
MSCSLGYVCPSLSLSAPCCLAMSVVHCPSLTPCCLAMSVLHCPSLTPCSLAVYILHCSSPPYSYGYVSHYPLLHPVVMATVCLPHRVNIIIRVEAGCLAQSC